MKNFSIVICSLLIVSTQFISEAQIKGETIFDRKDHIIDSIMEVPMYPRYEEKLGINGRYELVDDVNLWVEQVGEGIPLVLISGGPGTSHHYFHPHFSRAASFSKLIYYDMRGVGLSDYNPNDGFSIQQAVEDLENLRLKLGYDKWNLMGMSFGGVIAQVYALSYPHRLSSMILVSSALPMAIDIGIGIRQYDYMSIQERDRINQIYNIGGVRTAPVHSDAVNPSLQMQMLYNAFSNGDWKRRHLGKWEEEDIATYARYELVHARNYYKNMLDDYFKYDLSGAFKSCPIPTLLIEGKWNLAYGEDKWSIMKEQFPNAEKTYFEDAGHIPYEDKPEEFFKVLETFLSTVKKTSGEKIDDWLRSQK